MIKSLIVPDRFVEAILKGEKKHLLLHKGEIAIRFGDRVNLYACICAGKDRLIADFICTSSIPIEMANSGLNTSGKHRLPKMSVWHQLANIDGFTDFETMADWFFDKYTMPFEGRLIQWINKDENE